MNKKKHILVLPVNYPNSANTMAGTFFRSQVNALREFGHTVGVVSFCLLRVSELKHSSYVEQLEANNEIQLCFPAVPKMQALNHKIRTLLTKLLIDRYIKTCGKPDVIHVHVYSAAEAAIWAKKKYEIPYVITEHYSHFANNQITPYFHQVALRAFKNASTCLAVSRSLGNTLEHLFDIKFTCVPNIVDKEFTYQPCVSSQYGKFILNVASLTKIKNHKRLINAFEQVTRQNDSVNLVIVGDGPLKNELQCLAKKLTLENRIFFLGKKDKTEIAKLMNQAQLFCLSSDYETFGVVLIEALSCGLPVVAPNVGGIPEIINSDELGILCTLNENNMSHAILTQLDNKNDKHKVSYHSKQLYGSMAFCIKMDMILNSIE